VSVEWFSECKTITEVYAKARELKDAKEDPSIVNTLATKRKKELIINGNSDVNKLYKVIPKASSRQNAKVSSIIMQVEDINSAKIKITANNKVII
jgi:hypothetical protein